MKNLILSSLLLILGACASPAPAPTATSTGPAAPAGLKVSAAKATAPVRARAAVNGLSLYYEIHGDGPPLVLIHGGGSTLDTSFGRMIPLLARRHKVIAFDEQAHGRTPDIDRPVSFANTADDVAALLTALEIPKADVFGFSNGGTTALHFAIRHPGRVNRVVAASALTRHADAPAAFWKFMKTGTFEQMPQALKDEFLKVNPDPAALRTMWRRDADRMNAFKDLPSAQLRALTAPTLVIVAARDVMSVESALRLSQQLPRSRFIAFPGGHGNYLGELSAGEPLPHGPEFTAAAVSEFLLSSE